MMRGRLLLIASLVALPVIFLVGSGAYYLWSIGWAFWAWWPMGTCLALAYFLLWRWQKQFRLKQAEVEPELHWTDRDRDAWKIVEARVKSSDSAEPSRFEDPQFYFDTARGLADELARAYRPSASSPIGFVTVPELLAVIELAAHDLNEVARTYVPGSHLMTIDRWHQVRRGLDWYRAGSNVYWAVSAVFDPIRTATRFVAAKYGMGKPLELFQQNLVHWFFSAFVREVGFYLIELYSGRLKVGVARYRELMAKQSPDAATPSTEEPTATPTHVTIAVIGQVKAGKSSLINAILGEQRAATDVLPLTNEQVRYELVAPGVPSKLVLVDTAGYGRSNPKDDHLEETATAVQSADLIVMVGHARSPARKADVDFLARLRDWFATRPHLRLPPILFVATHVDLLTPAMEWAPPYDWLAGTRTKERQMSESIAAIREVLPGVRGAFPACTAEGRQWNVQEEVVPAIVALVDDARAVALLRCLHAEADEGRVRQVFSQVWSAAKKITSLLRGTTP